MNQKVSDVVVVPEKKLGFPGTVNRKAMFNLQTIGIITYIYSGVECARLKKFWLFRPACLGICLFSPKTDISGCGHHSLCNAQSIDIIPIVLTSNCVPKNCSLSTI